jgi:D-serine deaminase-like pyridoxal phosphate-dependent protein
MPPSWFPTEQQHKRIFSADPEPRVRAARLPLINRICSAPPAPIPRSGEELRWRSLYQEKQRLNGVSAQQEDRDLQPRYIPIGVAWEWSIGGPPVHLRAIIEAAMAAQKSMLTEFAWDPRYCVSEVDDVLTPALVLYPEFIASNIERTLALLGGDADRWRVHIKTAKLGHTLLMMVERGVRNFKCATTLELLVACQSGAADVLLAYPSIGANARRVREIADQFPKIRISVLAENDEQVLQWRGSRVGIFLDINPGMNRTGIERSQGDKVLSLARAVSGAGLEFRGLHYYDGQYGGMGERERTVAAHRGYDSLLNLAGGIEHNGVPVPEVITAGTPTLFSSLSYQGFRGRAFRHRVSPGTIVYCDATSLAQLPSEYGFRPAVLVLARVVSRPRAGIVTCDAGHKAVSADAGVPTCVVVGHPELAPLSPSEEHLPMALEEGAAGPQVGEALYLLPRHVCPTVNNFDCALLVRDGQIESVEKVSARGREAPLLRSLDPAISLGRRETAGTI